MTALNAKGETEAVVYESLPTIVFVENDSNDYMAARQQLGTLKLCNPIHRSHTVSGMLQYLELAQRYALKDPVALPCVIIMELKLPQTGGLDGQAMVRSSIHFRSIPIIAISATERVNALQHAVTLGANGFLVKPFEAVGFRKLADDLRLPLAFGSTPRKVTPSPSLPLPKLNAKRPGNKETFTSAVVRKLGLFSF
jgi:two-component system response regulator